MELSTKTKEARSRGPIPSHWMRGVANGGAISSHPRRRERSPHVPAKKRGEGDFAIAKWRTSSLVSLCLSRDANMPQILLLSRLSYLASSGYVSLYPLPFRHRFFRRGDHITICLSRVTTVYNFVRYSPLGYLS